MKRFDHEKLDVYTVSLDFVRFVHELTADLSPAHRNARDQLIRAAQSIPLNIAEGNAKVPGRDRTRFWEIARGSAMESAAALDILVVCEGCDETRVYAGKDLLFRIVSMLSRMTISRLETAREDRIDYESKDDERGKSGSIQIREDEYEDEYEDDNDSRLSNEENQACP